MNQFTSELNGIFKIIDSELNWILLSIIIACLFVWAYNHHHKNQIRYNGFTKDQYKKYSKLVDEPAKTAFKELSKTKENDK